MLPDTLKSALQEMRLANHLIISHGAWANKGGCNGLELLFEDNSDQPYCLHISLDQTDRLLPESDQGGGFVVTIWTREGQKLSMEGKYRKVKIIPCLEPWVEQ